MTCGPHNNREVVITGGRRKISFSNFRPGFSATFRALLNQADERGLDMRPTLMSGTLEQWRQGAVRGALGLLDQPE